MIPVKNIYYMLSYAYQVLKELDIREMELESFDNVQKLCAEILIKGVSVQIKRGLKRDYEPRQEMLSSIKGKIDVSDSIKTQSILRRQLVCSYDEFSEDTYLNRILKTTMMTLLRMDIKDEQKKKLRSLLIYFANVQELDIHSINWKMQYHRNDKSYEFLINVCYLVIKGLLQTQESGTVKMLDYLDEQETNRLYEKFILESYRKHYPMLHANPSPIDWVMEGERDSLLPMMKTDIMLQSNDNTVLIIDAKYYSHTTQQRFDKHTINSANLYQIFTYVKNKDYSFGGKPHKVSGMLLYARTDEEIQPDNRYVMSGNEISVTTLDLNQEFSKIAEKLNMIADKHFS